LPATEAFAKWLSQAQTSPQPAFSDRQTLGGGVSLAQARAQELRALMERDPQEFVRQAMPENQRAALSPQIQPFIEQHLKSRGFFGVYCSGLPMQEPPGSTNVHPHGGYAYEVRLNGTNYQAFVFGKWRDQRTVYEADIEGVALDGVIALGDAPTPAEQIAKGQNVTAYSPTTTGPNTLLYMIAQYSDQANSYPIDDATALSQVAVISNFWMNCSYGRVYLHGLVNSSQPMDIVHITLPQPSSYASTYNNNFSQLLSDARTAASGQGFNYANYNLDVLITSSAGYTYAGLSWIGAQGSHWVAGYTSLRTGGHELGHNLGLYHANYWRTDAIQPFGKDSNPGGYVADYVNGEWVEYGHYFSVMSAQYGSEWDDATKPIYNPVEKVQLGWLSGGQVQYVTASGTYRLFRNDSRTTVGTPRGIRIETPATDYTGYGRRYWLQYRYDPWSTAQSWFQNGIEVDVAQTSYGADGSILLDMTPYSKDQSSPFYDANNQPGSWWTIDNSDKVDGALIVGRSYDDVNAGIHITPIATGNNGTGEEYIDLVINLGSFASDRAPVISSFLASTNQVAVGQPVNFNVSASDPDGDALAYSWEFGEVQTWTASGLNNPTATKSWSSSGQYRVDVRVSDMKGGVTTASQIITVGAPASTRQIWGRVLWGGRPVYGARVTTTLGNQAWTDSDGSYVLTGLSASGSYTVNCQADGLTFIPQFSNPVSLAAGNAFGIDFYANQLLAAGGTTYSISGQVTDPVNGVAGAEVRGGGMVTTTDSSGNYQLRDLLNGSYTVVPRNGAWTFSPSSRTVTISSANSSGNNFSRVAPYSISGSFSGIPAGRGSPAPTVYLSNGRSVTATSAGSGNSRYWAYTLNNVPAGQFSISAELTGYSIVPSGFSNPLNITGNLSAINFSGSAGSPAGSITGRITQQGVPVTGVTIQANQSGTAIASTTSDSDGYYRIDNLVNGSYSIVPIKTGYSFSPSSLSVSSIPSPGNNFTANGPSSPPTISSVTANPAVVPGAAATTTLTVAASGAGPLTYSWDALSASAPVGYSANDSTGAASTTVSFQAPGSYTFRTRVTGTNGLPTTGTVNVTVSAGAGSMVVSPYQVQVPAGQAVSFSAEAWDQIGNRISVSPSWSVNGGDTINSNGLFSATTPGGPYAVIATSGTLSATGFVAVTSTGTAQPPSITTQPLGLAVAAGSNVTFTVVATGTSPLSYQWRFNGANIGGASASAYTRLNVQSSDAGSYTVVITNAAGSITSSPAMLTVNTAPLLAAINNRTIHAGSTLVVTNTAMDIDSPPQILTFSLAPGFPAGATIGPSNGVFTWSTTAAQAYTTNPVTVRVTDNGTPSLSDAKSFVITVIAPISISSIGVSNATVTITWASIPGTTYRVQFKNNLGDTSWSNLVPDVTATGTTASQTDAVGTTRRFYRIMLVN
jgi:hypothetical protein